MKMCARIGNQQHQRFYQRTVRISESNTTHAGIEEGEIEGQAVSRDNLNSTGKEISHSVHPANQPTHQSLHHLQTKPIYGTHQANQTFFVANSQGRRHPLPARVRTRGPPSPLISFTNNSEFSSTSFSLSRLCTLACVGNDYSGRSGREGTKKKNYLILWADAASGLLWLRLRKILLLFFLLFFLSFLLCVSRTHNFLTTGLHIERK